ncbi:MAG: antibiotic biosynthesis monooxygenase family protein [Nakamurella sp.]
MTRAPADKHRAAGVVRVATLTARADEMPALIRAAQANAAEARSQPGCLTADVCTVPDDPDRLIVLSRWETPDDLSAFLGWHEGVAHELISQASSVKPQAVHYRLA